MYMKLCWWCCHSLDDVSLQLPIHFDELNKEFVGFGQFCSFSCMKAYNNETKHTDNKHNSKMLITRMIQMSQPDPLLIIHCAPPRECLQAFGGHMSIEEFRNSRGSIKDIYIASVKRISYDVDWNQTTKVSSSSNDTDVETLKNKCSATKVINNPLKIKQKSTDSNIPTDSVLCMLNNLHDSVK